MKVLISFIVFAAVFAPLGYWQYASTQQRKRRQERKLESPALRALNPVSPADAHFKRLSLDMAFLLRDAEDPIVRQDDGWNERRKRLLSDYFGEN